MNVRPIKVELTRSDQLQIEWSDGAVRQYPVAELRKRCPCATCREKRQQQTETLLPVLSLAETLPTQIQEMRPIGNYAYSIAFSDGHDTGIFTLEFLRSFEDRDAEG